MHNSKFRHQVERLLRKQSKVFSAHGLSVVASPRFREDDAGIPQADVELTIKPAIKEKDNG